METQAFLGYKVHIELGEDIPGTGRKCFSDCDKVLQRKYLKAGGIS